MTFALALLTVGTALVLLALILFTYDVIRRKPRDHEKGRGL